VPEARKSKCIRFLASGTWVNQMFGPPQPVAPTKALLVVESSSTSDPKTAAQESCKPQSICCIERDGLELSDALIAADVERSAGSGTCLKDCTTDAVVHFRRRARDPHVLPLVAHYVLM
jgi:hypothetical protein